MYQVFGKFRHDNMLTDWFKRDESWYYIVRLLGSTDIRSNVLKVTVFNDLKVWLHETSVGGNVSLLRNQRWVQQEDRDDSYR